jgi:hypothetical protein
MTQSSHGVTLGHALTCVSFPVTLKTHTRPRPPSIEARAHLPAVGKAAPVMAKALFGHVVAPAELRVVEENAILRAKVRRLEQELEDLRAERDAHIASELLSLSETAEPALA